MAGEVLKQRVFAPTCYAAVRNTNIVAICASEAGRFVAHVPIAWRSRAGKFELVILRSFLGDGRGHLPGMQTATTLLPVLARAYPFLHDPTRAPTPGQPKFIDPVIADEPDDLGAPITAMNGRLTPQAARCIALLDASAASFAETAVISQCIADADLLEPWALRFEAQGAPTIELKGLWIVKHGAIATGAFAPLMRAHGLAAADLVALHRVSLFRTGLLLARARGALGITADGATGAPNELATGPATSSGGGV